MKLSNKIRFYLGMRSVVLLQGRYLATRRCGFIFSRVFFDNSDGKWWSQPYLNSYFNTAEEAWQAVQRWDIAPV